MQSVEHARDVLRIVQPLALTKAEKLQMLNLVPIQPVEINLVVEECEERIKEDQMEDLANQLLESKLKYTSSKR